jgi:hypothetical protein
MEFTFPFLSRFSIPEIASQFWDFAVLLECSCKHGILIATREKKGIIFGFRLRQFPGFSAFIKRPVHPPFLHLGCLILA